MRRYRFLPLLATATLTLPTVGAPARWLGNWEEYAVTTNCWSLAHLQKIRASREALIPPTPGRPANRASFQGPAR